MFLVLVFLGHNISPDICPLPEKMKALQDLQPFPSLHQLQHFLGLLNYFRRFIPHCYVTGKKMKNEQISLDTAELLMKQSKNLRRHHCSHALRLVPIFHWSLMHHCTYSCRCSVATAKATTTSRILFEKAETG